MGRLRRLEAWPRLGEFPGWARVTAQPMSKSQLMMKNGHGKVMAKWRAEEGVLEWVGSFRWQYDAPGQQIQLEPAANFFDGLPALLRQKPEDIQGRTHSFWSPLGQFLCDIFQADGLRLVFYRPSQPWHHEHLRMFFDKTDEAWMLYQGRSLEDSTLEAFSAAAKTLMGNLLSSHANFDNVYLPNPMSRFAKEYKELLAEQKPFRKHFALFVEPRGKSFELMAYPCQGGMLVRLHEQAVRQQAPQNFLLETIKPMLESLVRDGFWLCYDRRFHVVSSSLSPRVEEGFIEREIYAWLDSQNQTQWGPRLWEALDGGLQFFDLEARGKAYRMSVFPVLDTHGRAPDLAVLLAQDLGQSLRLQSELELAREQASRAEALRYRFLANISHEIRTPMNGIIGFSELLVNKELSREKQNRYLGFINESTHQLLNAFTNVLDLSKIQSGGDENVLEHVPLREILRNLRERGREELVHFEKEHLELREKSSECEEISILTDRVKLEKIMEHLIRNAVKFTYLGWLEIGCVRQGTGQVQFYVADSGLGFSPEKIDSIFDNFGKVGPNGQLLGGIGLGLTIARAYAEHLDSRLQIESEVGVGSKVFFTLRTEPKASTKHRGVQWAGKTILAVEDEEINLSLLEAMLEFHSAKVVPTRSGEEAIEHCARSRPDLVLMDIQLEGMDGFEATRAIKRLHPALPVLAVSAHALASHRLLAIEAGCEGFLPKPYTEQQLVAAIDRLLAQAGGAAGS